jgi:hypothetical protein
MSTRKPAAFDPDVYLAQTAVETFNPDAYLAATAPESPPASVEAKPALRSLLPAMFSGGAFTLPASTTVAELREASPVPALADAARRVYGETGASAYTVAGGGARALRLLAQGAQHNAAAELAQAGLVSYEEARRIAEANAATVGETLGLDASIAANREMAAFARAQAGADPARDQTILAKLAAGAGSLPVAIATGPAAPATIAALMGESGAQDAARTLAQRGVTDPEAIRRAEDAAFAFNAPVGLVSEAMLGAPALLRSVRAMGAGTSGAGRVATQTALGAAREGAQEGIEQLSGNVIAKDLVGYDPGRDRTEGVVEATLLGTALGAPVAGGFQTAQELDARRGHADFAQKLDTAKNVPESLKTLLLQQDQLARGLRPAVMFPTGTEEVGLPERMKRIETPRGVFHFNPEQVSAERIKALSAEGRENELLGLGPVSKPEAEARAAATGEPLVTVTERSPDRTEVKAAVGTTGTSAAQAAALEATKTPGNTIRVETPGQTIIERQRARQAEVEAKARAAVEAEAQERAARQAEADARKTRIEETLLAGEAWATRPDATFAQLQAAVKTIDAALEDNSLGLTLEQRQRAAALRARIAPRYEAAAAEEEVAAAARMTKAKADEAAEAARRKAAIKAENDALASIERTGRDPREGGVIVDITKVPEDEFWSELRNNLDAEGLDQPSWEKEAERRTREMERGDDGVPRFTLADVFTGKNGAKQWMGGILRLPTPDALREAGDPLAGDMEAIRESLPFSWFINRPIKLDGLAEQLRGFGFEFETPGELLAALRSPEDYRPRADLGGRDQQVDFAEGREQFESAKDALQNALRDAGSGPSGIAAAMSRIARARATDLSVMDTVPSAARPAALAYWQAVNGDGAPPSRATAADEPAGRRLANELAIQLGTTLEATNTVVRGLTRMNRLALDGYLDTLKSRNTTQQLRDMVEVFWRANRPGNTEMPPARPSPQPEPMSPREEAMLDRHLARQAAAGFDYRIERKNGDKGSAWWLMQEGQPVAYLGDAEGDPSGSAAFSGAVDTVMEMEVDNEENEGLPNGELRRRVEQRIAPPPSQAGSTEGRPPAPSPLPESDRAPLVRVARFFRDIATQSNAWQLGREGDPRRQSKDLGEVAASYSTSKNRLDADEFTGRIRIERDDRQKGMLTVSVDSGVVYVGASGAASNSEAEGGGKQAYQAIFTWAHNNGYRVHGSGLTQVNQVRRTVNMLSSALRHDTTAHLVPYATQEITQWRDGDHEANIGAMVLALSEQMNKRTRGQLDRLTYDPATDSIVDNVNGRRISEADLRRILETARLHLDGFGPSTARAILAGRAQLAANARGEGYDAARARDAANEGSLRGVLYAEREGVREGANRPGAERGREAGQPGVVSPTWRDSVVLSDAEVDAELRGIQSALPKLAAALDLKVGDLRPMLSEARGLDIAVPAAAEAAVTTDVRTARTLVAIAARVAREGKLAPRFLHEVGHKYWEVLPDYARAFLRQMHSAEVGERNGPLFDAQGKPTTRVKFLKEDLPAARVAADPDLPIKEWFCERLAALNQQWLDGRKPKDRPAMLRLWESFKRFLRDTFAAVRRLDPASEVFERAFRQWLQAGDLTTANTAAAFARGDRAQFATTQSSFDLGGTALGLELPNDIRNLTPRWQDKTLRFESNLDKALYYAGGEGRTATREGVVAHLQRETGLSAGEIATLARDLRRKLGSLAQGVAAGGTFRVPPQMQAEARRLTGVSFAEGAQAEFEIDDVNLPAAASQEQRAVALFARRFNSLNDRVRTDRDPQLLEIYIRVGQRAETLMENTIPAMTDEEVVELVNAVGTDSAAAGLILRVTQRARGWLQIALAYRGGTIRGGGAGELTNERSRLDDYGPLEAIAESDEGEAATGESRILRTEATGNERSLFAIRGATRNELKFAMWDDRTTIMTSRGPVPTPARRYIGDAISGAKEKFLRSVTSEAARLINLRTGLTPEAFWRAAKHGDVDVINTLAQNPSRHRKAYKAAGRYVGPIDIKGARPAQPASRSFTEQQNIDFAEGELFEGAAAGDADRTTTGDYLAAADRFREETAEVPEGSPLDRNAVRELAPYLIGGNKGDIVGKHGRFLERLARGASRVFDAFGGAAIYSHYLAGRDALPAGSVWNEWEYTRSITNRQLATATDAVVAELDQIKNDFRAAFPGDAPQDREQMLALRQRIKEWMDVRLRELVPNPSTDEQGRLVLPDTPRTAAFYLFAQNHMTQGRVVDFEVMDGRATFATGGKANGKDDFTFVDEDGWRRPRRIWHEEMAANLRDAARRLQQIEVRQGDGWQLAAEAPDNALVFVDSSYFQSDRELAEGKQVMNYGTATLADGQWDQWLDKARQRLVPRGGSVRYVVTNNFNAQVVAELENAGWTVLRTTRRNKNAEAHELVALSPAAARAAGVSRGARTQARPDHGVFARSARGRRAELRPGAGTDALDLPPGNEKTARAAALKAALPPGVTTGAKLEAKQDEAAATLSTAAKAARHPAAQGEVEEGIAWASAPKLTPDQLRAEIRAISDYLNDQWLDLSDIEKANLRARQDGLKAELDRRPGAEQKASATSPAATPVIPRPDRKTALLAAWREGKSLRDEGQRNGNQEAWDEGQKQVTQAKAALDREYPGWEEEANPSRPTPRADEGPRPARPDQVAQDDGRNISTPPPEAPERGAPSPDEPAPNRGRARQVWGHSGTTPSWWARTWERAREALVGIRGSIPELPAFPSLFNGDRFIRERGPNFYDGLRAFHRALASGNDYVQRVAEEQVATITTPLLRLGGRFDAEAYAKLRKRREQQRRLAAENRPMPAGAQAELDALETRLESHPYVLFNKLVFFMDLDWRRRNLKDSEGNPIRLPGSLNETEMADELARLGNAVAASPHAAAIEAAFEKHLALVKQVADDLKARDLLAAEHLANPFYFPHVTLEVNRGGQVEQRELKPERVRVGTEADFRGYLQDPVGSDKAIESDYVRAMYYHLVQVGAHNLKADAIRDHVRPYDVRAEVEKRAKALGKNLGRTVSWEQAFHMEYAPNGYVLYGTDSRDAFPTVQIDRDKLARRLGVILTSEPLEKQLAELGLKGIKLLPEDLRETLVQGQREVWVVPARVAEALRGIADRQKAVDQPIEAAMRALNSWWKRWKLFMPQNHIRYEYGNVVADLEKLVSASPRTFKKLAQAAKEMREFFDGGTPSADLRAALKDGVINAITAQEMQQLQRLRAFEKFETAGERMAKRLRKGASAAFSQPIFQAAWTAGAAASRLTKTQLEWYSGLGDLSSVELSAFREGVTRYANYLANLEAIRAGARPDYAGAYWRDIEAIGDSRPGANDRATRQAAQISKATFGDYADLSVTGQWLRDKLIPFYSWIEVNFKYHANLLRNNLDLLRGQGTRAQGATAVARQSTALVGGFVLRLALPYAAVALWNALGSGVDDDELSEEDRRRFHIRLGHDAEGRPVVIYANTALADVMKWFGGPRMIESAGAWLRGDTDFLTALDRWAGSIPGDLANQTIGSAGPTVKLPAMLITGRNFFPDVLDSRKIPDYDMRRAILAQMTDEFTADQVERTVNADYAAPKDYGTWAKQLVLQMRTRDPESWAFYSIKDKAAQFSRERTGQKRDSAYDAPDQQVLRNFRRAIYQGDVEAAAKFYLRLLDYGYTAERFGASIRAQEPLAGLPKELRKPFVESLSPTERTQLDRAYAYWTRIGTMKGTERALFPRDATGERGLDYYRRNPRLDVLERGMDRRESMEEDEVLQRADAALKRSLAGPN